MSKEKYLKRNKDKGPSELTRKRLNSIKLKQQYEKERQTLFAKQDDQAK